MDSFYRGKRVLVTGHTGFKGAWLCRILQKLGAKVIGYALEPKKNSLYLTADIGAGMRSVIGDVRDLECLSQTLRETGPEVVFHLAAQPLVGVSFQEPAETFAVNLMGTVNLLQAVRSCHSVRSVLVVTTDKVYSNDGREDGYREEERLGGADPYSSSKACVELAVDSWRQSFFSGLDSPSLSTARAGNVIGGGDFAEGRILTNCVSSARLGETILLRHPNSIRPYQHVLDCLRGYLLLAWKQAEQKDIQGSYNLGPDSEHCISAAELAGLFCEYWGEGASWTGGGTVSFPEAEYLRLNSGKAKKALRWEQVWDIRRAMRETVEMYRAVQPALCMDAQINNFFVDAEKLTKKDRP